MNEPALKRGANTTPVVMRCQFIRVADIRHLSRESLHSSSADAIVKAGAHEHGEQWTCLDMRLVDLTRAKVNTVARSLRARVATRDVP